MTGNRPSSMPLHIRTLESGAEAFLQDLLAIEEDCFCQPMWVLAEAVGETMPQRIAGSVWCQVVLDEGYIGNVAVCRDFRRQGIADRLLYGLDAAAVEKKLHFLTLEVREGNHPAIALYEKHGYAVAGVRRDYYRNPKENALLMTKIFTEGE